MAYSAPTTRATGFLVTAAVWNQDVVDNVAFLANPPACRVSHSSTQAVGDGAFLDPVLFNTEAFDTDGMHSTSSNTGRIVMNTAGLYVVSAGFEMEADTDYNYVQLQILLNGATWIGGATVQGNSGTSYEPWVTATTLYKFTAGQFASISAFQDTAGGGNKNIKATNNFFSAIWVGLG